MSYYAENNYKEKVCPHSVWTFFSEYFLKFPKYFHKYRTGRYPELTGPETQASAGKDFSPIA